MEIATSLTAIFIMLKCSGKVKVGWLPVLSPMILKIAILLFAVIALIVITVVADAVLGL
jgi:hypothetical protein